MMKTRSPLNYFLTIATCLILGNPGTLTAQETTREFENARLLKGFVKRISGDTLTYYSFNPLARTAMLTRCTGGEMAIQWQTEAIPADSKGEFAYFIWISSYSTYTGSGARNFDFFINGLKCLTFRTSPEKSWKEKSADGTELTFQLVQEDLARDANGYCYLRVPLSKFKKGEPLVLKVVGEKARVSDWFMTFMYDMKDRSVAVLSLPVLTEVENRRFQIVFVGVNYLGNKGKLNIKVEGASPVESKLHLGANNFEFAVPAVGQKKEIAVTVSIDGIALAPIKTLLKPVRPMTIYLLPHSHNDIGYTDLQTNVLKKQVKNIYDALDLIRQTADYPPEASFKWNVEVLWAVESFLETATPEKQQEFIGAVRSGRIGLQGLYLNMLTGIMRPEEFFRLTGFARNLKEKYGFEINSAMMSDVPGLTWNVVPALAQTGIRYFSNGPNGPWTGGDRVGPSNHAWADRPFYWTSQSGNEKILFWMTGFGYGSLFKGVSEQNPARLDYLKSLQNYFDWLDEISYPYEMIQMRHTVNGDNGTVDAELSRDVVNWNKKYVSPRFEVATSSKMFEDFEKRYGNSIPSFSGDFTPFWEDGALSSAYELGLTRRASEKLVRSEALFALLAPGSYDEEKFYQAWKNVLLFDEHTWGAWNSIQQPDSQQVTGQWEIKRQFAWDAAAQADELLAASLANPAAETGSASFDVINTCSWVRSGLVIIPKSQSLTGDKIVGMDGNAVVSQRLSNGDLAFMATGIPPLGARRFRLEAGTPAYPVPFRITGHSISDESVTLQLNPITGSISRLSFSSPKVEFVDTTAFSGLNEYVYVEGLNPLEAVKSGKTVISLKENGPLVASFLVESEAPGCRSLKREVRIIHGLNQVELINTLDKEMVRAKESVHFGFPFRIPEAVVRYDLGFGVVRPESDQLPGSCKDYYSAQRWVDLSNQEYGLTMSVDEAPLIEVKEMRNEDPVAFPMKWKTRQEPSSTIFSYVMNNYWHTNYKADQEGVSVYHYAIQPHGVYNQVDATRFGAGQSQPLVLRRVTDNQPVMEPLFTVSPSGVIVSYLKPLGKAKGFLVRLYNAGGKPEEVRVSLRKDLKSVWLSNPEGEKLQQLDTVETDNYLSLHDLSLQAYGVVTLVIN